jgi:hypothetical protein
MFYLKEEKMNTPVKFPEVKGNFKVGFSHLNFVDQTRQVIFPEHENHFRDIPVMIWYPAKQTEGYKPRMCTSREEFQAEVNGVVAFFPPEMDDKIKRMFEYQEITTHSFVNAPIIDENALPTVFFAHGYTWTMWQNQIQFEHLASHGYVVISFGIPQEGQLQYPDGKVVPTSPEVYKAFFSEHGAAVQDLEKWWDILGNRKKHSYEEIRETAQIVYDPQKEPFCHGRMQVWYEDFLFVLKKMEELNQSNTASPFHGKLNLDKIGFFGMSMGGGLASLIAYKKAPVSVAGTISLDGPQYGMPYDARIERPHMIVQSNEASRLLFEQMEKDAYYITVGDTGHQNFTDSPYVSRGIYQGLGLAGGIDPDRMVEIMNTSILAFFDHYVCGLPIDIRLEIQHLPGIEIEIK